MASSSFAAGLVFFFLMTFTGALQVTPGSSCSSVCGASTSKTNSSDIICSDFDYYATGTGSTFMNCIECLQTSKTTNDSENDVSWFLYNLRYASAACIYDFPRHNETQTTTCNLEYACAPLQGALEYGNLNQANETDYGYCQADSDAFYGTSIDGCVSCLRSSPSTYTANFLLALQAGCQQQPSPGMHLSISGSLFSTTPINITHLSSSASNSSTTSSSTSNDDDNDNDRVLSLTAVIGIAVGLGVLFLLAAGLFTLYCCRQRRQAREDAGILQGHSPYHPQYHHQQQQSPFYYNTKPPHSDGGGPGAFTTGQSYAMPHYTVDYKSQLTDSHGSPGSTVVGSGIKEEEGDDDGFSNNAEYYDRLEGRSRGRPLQAHPVRLMHDINTTSAGAPQPLAGALPTHPAYIPRSATPGQLGARASRGGSVRSGSRASSRTGQRGAVAKRPSYAMEVFLDARDEKEEEEKGEGEEEKEEKEEKEQEEKKEEEEHRVASPPPPCDRAQAPSRAGEAKATATATATPRDIRVELAGPHDHEPPVPPPAVSWRSRRASASSASSPPPPAPGLSSLILPSVPRIRAPGRNKPPRLRITDTAGVEHDGNGQVDISGPLAFPDRRFAGRSPGDRIIEQTVDRRSGGGGAGGGLLVEVPIGSGKSYLYG